MKTASSALHYTDYVLSDDRAHWFSLRYSGISSRSELWLMLQLLLVLNLFPGMLLAESHPLAYELIHALIMLLFFFPLFIRRARQMGSIVHGITAIIAYAAPQLLRFYSYGAYGWNAVDELLNGLPQLVQGLTLIPLLLWGGTYSGRKNELHRAAISGDRERAERMMAAFPNSPCRRSEKGYLASEYAERRGYDGLAAMLREKEAEREARAN